MNCRSTCAHISYDWIIMNDSRVKISVKFDVFVEFFWIVKSVVPWLFSKAEEWL